jgi:hypothetical protein
MIQEKNLKDPSNLVVQEGEIISRVNTCFSTELIFRFPEMRIQELNFRKMSFIRLSHPVQYPVCSGMPPVYENGKQHVL